MYFSSEYGETANITSPTEYLQDGCLSFYYNMEGGPSAQLTVYVNTDGKSELRFIKDGVGVRRDEWVQGQIPIKGGRIYVEFAAYGTEYFSKPGVVALDDVRYVEGESCPEKGTGFCLFRIFFNFSPYLKNLVKILKLISYPFSSLMFFWNSLKHI